MSALRQACVREAKRLHLECVAEIDQQAKAEADGYKRDRANCILESDDRLDMLGVEYSNKRLAAVRARNRAEMESERARMAGAGQESLDWKEEALRQDELFQLSRMEWAQARMDERRARQARLADIDAAHAHAVKDISRRRTLAVEAYRVIRESLRLTADEDLPGAFRELTGRDWVEPGAAGSN